MGETGDAEAFWRQAKENLQAGRYRMIFVADIIPMELLRIIEFLNGQMDPAQVMALEVRQFVGQGLTALVPKVVGQTAAALQKKGSTGQSEKRQWNENSFFTALTERQGPEVRELLVPYWTGREDNTCGSGGAKASRMAHSTQC